MKMNYKIIIKENYKKIEEGPLYLKEINNYCIEVIKRNPTHIQVWLSNKKCSGTVVKYHTGTLAWENRIPNYLYDWLYNVYDFCKELELLSI